MAARCRKEIAYAIVDVFTSTPFLGGSPLAVVNNATSLGSGEMLNIAREFGFAETTFILPPADTDADADADARVRIFTPAEEIPFAGHANIGTAYVIGTETTVVGGLTHSSSSDRLVFRELGGAIEVELIRDGAAVDIVTGASITAPQSLEKEVWDLSALAAIELDRPAFEAARRKGPGTIDGFALSPFVVVWETDHDIHPSVRNMSPFAIPMEDPRLRKRICGIGRHADPTK